MLKPGLFYSFAYPTMLVSGMANPAKVLGFLDLASAWDPSASKLLSGDP